MDHTERGSQVYRGPCERPPIGVRIKLEPVVRTIEMVNFPMAYEPRHEETDGRSLRPFVQGADRPGGNLNQRIALSCYHRTELVGLRYARVVELRDQIRTAFYLKDTALAAGRCDFTGDEDRATLAINQTAGHGTPQFLNSIQSGR